MSNEGKKVKVHYEGTFDNGEVFDSSYESGEPIEFVCMAGNVVKGFDNAVVDMKVGDKKKVHLEPEEAYGEKDDNLIQQVPLEHIPNADQLPASGTIYFQSPEGIPIPAEIVEKGPETVTFDMNHPMAGKPLNFEIELVSVED